LPLKLNSYALDKGAVKLITALTDFPVLIDYPHKQS